MMKRYYIRVGDKTTAGGVVTQGEEHFRYRGVAVAYQGAEVYCHTCKSVGRIVNIPPYRPMLIMGKQIALEYDICACKCDPAPHLIASQNTGSMSFESRELAQTGLPSAESLLSTAPSSIDFDDRFKLFDASANRPLADMEYAILRANGEIEHGITDGGGHTHLLSSTIESEDVHIYV
jgi:uncharacterized Zn-binding protein involved in type VI secretion